MKEYMVRLVYCDMLGYDISFAYIHAVKLAQQGALLEKRVGKSVTERWGYHRSGIVGGHLYVPNW